MIFKKYVIKAYVNQDTLMFDIYIKIKIIVRIHANIWN